MKKQEYEFKLIQKGMFSRDVLTTRDIDDLNKIQNEKAKEFLEKYPNAVVGKINWYKDTDKEFPLLKDQLPLKNFSFNFALPEKNGLIEQAIKIYNEAGFEAKAAVKHLGKINDWINGARGIQLFWL